MFSVLHRFVRAMTAAAADARYGARVLKRTPGYALVVIATIALGIGANAAIFSVVHAVLWRSLPYPDASRLVTIAADPRGLPSAYDSSGAAFDLRAQSRFVTNLAQAEGRDASILIDGEMERVAAARVTDDLLPLFGASPLALGRTLVSADDVDGVVVKGVVISHELWQGRFHGDPAVVGRRLVVNNFDVQVVGVVRPDLRVYLPAADHVEERIDVWLPAAFAPGRLFRGSTLVGRLAPGATIAQAQAECSGLAPGGLRLSVRPLADAVTGDAKPALLALGAAVGFVLLIACVNVANLTLVRAKSRERELAVRRALGATRLRLIRQLLAEHLVVAAIGGACGLLLARIGLRVMTWLRPTHLPRQSEIAIDGSVVLWTAGLTVAVSVVFGLVSALAFARDTSARPLQSGRAGALMMRSRRMHRALVVLEVALSIVPLVAAGLMLRTFTNLLHAPIGFDPSGVVTARIPLNLQTYSTVERRSAFYRDAIARVQAVPGVAAASVGGPLPFAPAQVTQRYARSDDPAAATIGLQQSLMPGYFGVMGIPLRAGRDFSDDDLVRRRRVAIVDERIAAQLWNGDAVGHQLTIGQAGAPVEIVGVAAPIRAREIREASTPMIYVPSHLYEIEQTLVVKMRDPGSAIGPAIKRAVESLDPGRAVFDIRALDEVVRVSIDDTRFTMLVLSGFAMASLLLAGVGLYGTLAYLLSQRTQEFGVRVALGASAGGILRLVVREGSVLTGVGAALGLAGAIATTGALRRLLYGVTPLDGVTIAGVVALVALVAALAVGWPAWRAARVDPVTALRAD
jgi:predicted permease